MKSSNSLNNEIQATFRFVGDAIDPQIITSKLGIQPSKAHVKGQPVKEHIERVYSTGYWGIDSSCDSNRSLEEHLAYLLDILEPKAPILRQIKEMGFSPNFYCGLFISSTESSALIKLDTTILERMACIGAALDIHLYCCDDEIEHE